MKKDSNRKVDLGVMSRTHVWSCQKNSTTYMIEEKVMTEEKVGVEKTIASICFCIHLTAANGSQEEPESA